jgi:hypothetical protein
MTSERMEETFKGDPADTRTGKFPLVSMGGRADTSSVRRRGMRTPIGASGNFCKEDIPQFHPSQVWLRLSQIKTNKATVAGYFPAKLIKPITDIINISISRGEYPQIYKFEICTPVPKAYPTQSTSQLRNISSLFNFDKITESLLSELIILDMKSKMDPSQYGNQGGISI